MTIGAPIWSPASPIAIRDGTASRLEAVAGLTQVFKARSLPGQDDQVPYAAVWFGGERTQALGDPNVAAPKFQHTLTLVIDIFANAGSEAALDTEIVSLVETSRATLLSDASWVGLFEGIERIDTRYAYPKDTETMLCQAMIEIEVSFKSEWPPVVPNALKTVATRVAVAPGWTCRFCQAANETGRPACRVCHAPGHIPTVLHSKLELDR